MAHILIVNRIYYNFFLRYKYKRFNLGGQCFDRLQVEVEVEVEVVEILAVDQQVQHVVALPTNLKSNLHPVQCRCLEKLGRLE